MAAQKTEGLIKNFIANGVIAPRRIVAMATGSGATDDMVVQAASATVPLIGIAKIPIGYLDPIRVGVAPPTIGTVAGDRIDVVMSDIAEVEYGGTITRGDFLMPDSSGRAIRAVAGAGVRTIGIATTSGVSGDLGYVDVSPAPLTA